MMDSCSGLQTSTLLTEMWKAGVTHVVQEQIDPHQSKEPSLVSHFGQFSYKNLNT